MPRYDEGDDDRPSRRRRRDQASQDDDDDEDDGPRRRRDDEDDRPRRTRHEAAAAKVRIPAIGLMASGGVGLIVLAGILVMMAAALLGGRPGGGPGKINKFQIVLTFLALAWPFVVAWGGWNLWGLRSRKAVLQGAIMAMIPCNPAFLLGLAFGIWAVVAINDRRVSRYLDD